MLEERIDHGQKLSSAAHLFPVTGLAIGAVAACIWMAASYFLPGNLAAGIAILATICLTGALHEDGLSDSADGLFGGNNKDRRLEIMKDSTIGTFGAVALIFSIGLRWAVLMHLTPTLGAIALILAHGGARAVMTYPICFSRYARTQGVGHAVADGLSFRGFLFAMATSLTIAWLLGGWAGLVAIVLALLCGLLFLKLLDNKLGGYTGDGLGAIEQIAEIVILLTLSSYWIAL